MFICSMKMTRKKVAVLTAVIIVLAVGVFSAFYFSGTELGAASQGRSLSVSSDQDVAEYIRSFGWEIEEVPTEVVSVAVPETFNQVYENYNQIQKKQGFDLEGYKGMDARRYTYAVVNYPDYPDNIRADVIVCDGKIIAADICSIELQGFLHGIRQQDAQEWTAANLQQPETSSAASSAAPQA